MNKIKALTSISAVGVSMVMLTGCSALSGASTPSNASNSVSSQDINNTSGTGKTISSPSNESSNQTKSSTAAATSATASSSGVRAHTYASTSDAVQAVANMEGSYASLHPSGPPVNLGLGIKADFNGGAGQYAYWWHEGNWTVIVAGSGNSSLGTQVSKKMVAYLHTHMLPAPQKSGVIFVKQVGSSNTSGTWQSKIAWQEGATVHELKQTGEPIQALVTVIATNHKGSSSSGNVQQVFVNHQVSGRSVKPYQEVFLSKDVGFGIASLGGGMSHFKYVIERTTTGGKTWTKQGTVGASHVFGISFINQQTGFFLNNSPAYQISPDLYVTHDGGAKWTEQRLPVPSQFQQSAGSNAWYRESKYPIFFTSNVGVIPVYGFQGNGKNHFLYMLTTSDGGSTWKAVLQPTQNLSWVAHQNELSIHYEKQSATILDTTGTWTVTVQ